MEENSLEKKLLGLINKATGYRASLRDKEYLVNRAHFEGLHWNLAENNDKSPFLLRSDINHLKNAVTLRLGSTCADKYWGELQPLSPNDVDAVNNLNILYKNEWDRLKADDLVEAAIKDGAICDNGYIQINFDPDKIIGGTMTKREGAITLKQIDPANVYLDPAADSINDCTYMVIRSQATKEWIEINHPEWMDKIKSEDLKAGNVTDNSKGDIYTGRNYSSSRDNGYTVDTIYLKEVKNVDVDITDPIDGAVTTTKAKRTVVTEYVMIGDTLIHKNDKYPFDEFPIIPFQWEPMPQSPYGIPLLRGLTVPQKVANLIESAANNIAMHYTIPTYLVSEESGIDIDKFAKLSNALGMAWKVNGSVREAVAQLDPPKVDEQLIGIKNSFVQNIFSYAGISDAYVGNIGTAGSTAEGTNDAINRATIIDNPVTKQIEIFVEKLSRMIVKFMVRYYKDQTIYVRETSKNDKSYEFKGIKLDDSVKDINFEFNVDLASRSKVDKNRQYNLMKDLYTIQNQYKDTMRIINIPDLVKAAHLDNYDEMFKRYQDMSEEAFAEKADLIVQIMQVGGVMTPNGTPLITAEEMQQGMIDVLDDNGSLEVVEGIFNKYKAYQEEVAALQNQAILQDQQNEINAMNNAQAEQEALANQLLANYQTLSTPTESDE